MASPASAVTPAFAERLVAFSCKGRGVCPSCSARRMGGVAAHLTDQVLPPLPLRQWVLSLPKRIRPFLPHDPRLAGDVLRVLLRGIRTTLRRASPSATGYAQLGAVSFLHRFGSALNPHFHFHVVVLDGVFSEGDDGSATFHEATHLSTDDVLRLERTLQRRVFRLLRRRGLLDEHTVEDMLTWQASRGFSLDASVRIHGSDAAGRERLLRYGARPPFALERLRIDRRRRRARATQRHRLTLRGRHPPGLLPRRTPHPRRPHHPRPLAPRVSRRAEPPHPTAPRPSPPLPRRPRTQRQAARADRRPRPPRRRGAR
jgi:hypothetical protein